jgi:hypothetical protein
MRKWTKPEFSEIRMDAEIGSYQDDFGPERDEPAFVTPTREGPELTTATTGASTSP